MSLHVPAGACIPVASVSCIVYGAAPVVDRAAPSCSLYIVKYKLTFPFFLQRILDENVLLVSELG